MHPDFRVSSITPEQRVAARKGPIRLGEKTVHLVLRDVPQETLELADKQFVEVFGRQVRRIRLEDSFATCMPYGIACPFNDYDMDCSLVCDNITFWVTEETFPKLLAARLAAS